MSCGHGMVVGGGLVLCYQYQNHCRCAVRILILIFFKLHFSVSVVVVCFSLNIFSVSFSLKISIWNKIQKSTAEDVHLRTWSMLHEGNIVINYGLFLIILQIFHHFYIIR